MSLLIEQATKMHKKRQQKTSESLKCLKTRLFLKSKLNQKAKISYQHFVRNSNENNKQISIQADLSCFCPLPKLVSDSILKVILTQDHKVQLKTVIASNRLPLCVRSTAAKVQLLKHLSDLSSRQNILNKCSRSLIKIDRQTGEISTRFTIQLSLILFNLFPSILFDKLASIISSACNEIVSDITNCLSFLNLIRRSKKHSRFFLYKQVISRFLAPSTISENQQSQKTSSYSQKNIDNSSIPCYLINNIYQYKKNKLNRTTPLNNYRAIDCLFQEFNNLQPPLYAFANVKKIKRLPKDKSVSIKLMFWHVNQQFNVIQLVNNPNTINSIILKFFTKTLLQYQEKANIVHLKPN